MLKYINTIYYYWLIKRLYAENCFFSHCLLSLGTHLSVFFQRLNLFCSFGKAVTLLQKLFSTHWFPTRDIPRLPSLPLRRWYDPKARRFVCLGKENILWGQVKQDVLECGPSLLLALCNNALCGANAHTHTNTYERVHVRVHIHIWNALPNNHILGFGKCLSDRLSSCIYLKRGVCD